MQRTIIVGDVHGCRRELEQLLDRIRFSSGDRLVFVGDLIARGPDSLGVLDVARRTGALIVRGNHEQKLLDWHDDEETELGRTHLEVAQAMRDVDWTLLETSPLWLDLPEHGARVVHAGVVPGVPIEQQDPNTLMRIRTVGKRKTPWGERYRGAPHVVFGHNALGGLQMHAWATGLDTACVYGGRLSAMVLREGERIPSAISRRRALIVQQTAARAYFDPPKRFRIHAA
ncbi:MAG TPA: metallophosphoesterase [Polyangiaceae bacterium]|nr:metallophosphoesterase [Polyangiaceae bacterium]